MTRAELLVGERARRDAGWVIRASLALASLFVAFTWMCKETPSLYVHQPWQDDPFDVIVSLDFLLVPLLVAIGMLRAQLCRRYQALPARRLLDLLRLCTAALGVLGATELSEWIAVALRLHSAVWTTATDWQMAVLSMLTAATIGIGVQLRRARRATGRAARAGAQPDWLTDAVTLGLSACQILGHRRVRAQAMLRSTDAQVINRVRRYPVIAAAVIAAVLALPYVAAKIVLEGYPPALVLLSFALPASSLFAFVVLVGAYLRIVEPQQSVPPRWLTATVAACIAGPVTFAFHDSLLVHQTAITLNALLFGGSLAGGALTLSTQLALGRYRAHA